MQEKIWSSIKITQRGIRNGRQVLGFTIPIKKLRGIKANEGDFIRVNIKKGDIEAHYYIFVNKKCHSRKKLQIRKAIPKEIIAKLRLKDNDLIKFKVSLINNIRKEKLIIKGYIDILAAIPKRTKSNKEIMLDYCYKRNKGFCHVWYCSGQGKKIEPIRLNRWIKINCELGEFFGLMQAESRKAGTKFDFTNNLISEHKLFTKVAENFGIKKQSWKYSFFYNPYMKEEDTNIQVSKFKKEFNISHKVNLIKNERLTKVAFCSYINSTLLGWIMTNILCQLRSEMGRQRSNNERATNFRKGFISKVLLGDGTVVLNKANKGLDISISEQDPQSQKDIKRILKKEEIGSYFMQNRIDLLTGFEEYLWLLKNNAFINHPNRKKMIRCILSNFYVNCFYTRLREKIDKEQFQKKHKLNKNPTNIFLYRNYKRGYLIKKGKTYELSKKGKEAISILKNAEKELKSSLTNT